MTAKNKEFFIQTSDTEKRLFVSRMDNTNAALSPCIMTPDDVDSEMHSGKNHEMLEIIGMNQRSLEHFVKHYARTYRFLSFFKCQLIDDFSPLEELTELEEVEIYWNIRANQLWDFSKNKALKSISISDAKRISHYPEKLRTSNTLCNVRITGDKWAKYPMDSLACFSDMQSLRDLELNFIKLCNRNIDFLDSLPSLERFDFDAGMFCTEEIAQLAAKYPKLQGRCLGAYTTDQKEVGVNDVRVCGYRKPGLDLPEHQKRLDKYISEFDELVKKYKASER